jgi:hypothetical protein
MLEEQVLFSFSVFLLSDITFGDCVLGSSNEYIYKSQMNRSVETVTSNGSSAPSTYTSKASEHRRTSMRDKDEIRARETSTGLS